jgi:hypothetical protein
MLFNAPKRWDDPETKRVDIATVRANGGGLKTLTSDGVSVWPQWTRDGRIIFVRWSTPDGGPGDLWIMDEDGGNAERVDASIPAMTAAGCAECPYPIGAEPDPSRPNLFYGENGLNLRLWQPVSAGQP